MIKDIMRQITLVMILLFGVLSTAFAQEKGPKFSVIDFYLYIVERQLGVLRALQLDVPMMDIGKIDHIEEAESFALSYTRLLTWSR